MIAAAAILSLVVDLSIGPLFVYPGYDAGATVRGGFELAHALRPGLSLLFTARAGATYAAEWRPLYEASAGVSWHERVDVHAGLRHDDRLRREGALADFRDPTGRMFLGAAVFPFSRGRFSAGGTLDYEHALPGTGRLPSSVGAAVAGRVRLR